MTAVSWPSASGSGRGRHRNRCRQALRRRWVEESLADGTFAEQMTAAIDAFTSRPRLGCDHRYFRIHDSGDFAWAGFAYFDAVYAAEGEVPE